MCVRMYVPSLHVYVMMFITSGRIGDNKNSCLIFSLTIVYQIKQVPFCSWLKIIKIMNGN